MKDQTAAVVVIGNEVLGGLVEESNATFLTAELRLLGVRLRRVVVIPDEIDTIAGTVRDLSEQMDFVISTGGVGPTHDDVTLQGMARAFDRPLVRHEEFAARLSAAYGERVTAQVLTMADLPAGAKLVGGDSLRIPVVQIENVFVFPGIPQLLRNKFHAIAARFQCRPFIIHRVVVKTEESLIARHLGNLQARYQEISVGSYPRASSDGWEVMLQLESKDPELLDQALRDLIEGLSPESVVRVERDAQNTSTSPSE